MHMQMLLTLMLPKFLSMKNSLSTRVMLKRAPFIAIGMGFWILLYIGTLKVLSFIRGIDFFGEVLSAKLLSMTFFGLTGFLILSNVITAISSFYLSKDIPFLLTKPVSITDVLRLKSLETFLNSSWMVMSFVPPVFIAYGVSYHASAGYYIAISSVFLLFLTPDSRHRHRHSPYADKVLPCKTDKNSPPGSRDVPLSPSLFHDEISHPQDTRNTGRPSPLLYVIQD